MNINIVWGVGHGPTEKSSYDSALKNTGVQNYNLTYLSSIIPTSSKIIESKSINQEWNTGSIIPVVESKKILSEPKEYASVGIGWKQTKNGSGVFIEESSMVSKEKCKMKIINGLNVLENNRPEWNWEENIEYKIIESTANKKYTTVLVLAVFKPLRYK